MNATHEVTAYGRMSDGVIGNWTITARWEGEHAEDVLTGVYYAEAQRKGFRLIGEPVVTAI